MRKACHLAPDAALETLWQTELHAIEDGESRGIMAERRFDRRAPDRRERRADLGGCGSRPVVSVPGLERVGRREQPRLRRGDLLAGLHDLVREPGVDRR